MLPYALVAYLILFILVGVLFLFVSLLIGRFLRPSVPSATKGEAYECGEPAVGSGFLQFDLRFYVVALLFIIFEVELAFFFPPAVVFGKLNQLRGPNFGPIVEFSSTDSSARITPTAKEKFAELTIPAASIEQAENQRDDKHAFHDDLKNLSLMALLDIAVFFVVLLVGFAFLWKQGDLNWVRAVGRPENQANVKLAAVPLPGDMP